MKKSKLQRILEKIPVAGDLPVIGSPSPMTDEELERSVNEWNDGGYWDLRTLRRFIDALVSERRQTR